MDTSTLPAQSSPAFPLPPQPRLDLLPTELLQEIIDDLAPIPRSCLEYEGRQRNLLSLCLTCKRLLSFAQPVLFFAIELTTEEEVNAVLRKKELLVHCRWLTLGRMDRLEVLDPDDPRLTAIQVVAEAAIRLVGLGCGCDFQMIEPFLGLSEFRFPHFGRGRRLKDKVYCTDLKILCLVDLELPISTHLSLPQLEQLTLHEVRIEDPPTGATQHNLPSLRHVAAGTDHRLPLDDSMSTLLAGLAPQLVSMSADIDAVSIPQASIWNDSALIFQQQCTSDDILLVISRKAHIRFLQVDFQGSFSDDDGRELAAWTELVETAGPSFPLQCITLETREDPQRIVSLTPLQQRFSEACEERRIELVYEAIDGYFPYSERISPAFIKRAEERRRRVAEGEKQNRGK